MNRAIGRSAGGAAPALGTAERGEVRRSPSDPIRVRINGAWQQFELGRDIETSHTLAYLLRERLGLTGLKVACDEGACGACTVLMDGEAILSCMTLAVEADGHEVLTIEGLPEDDPVIEAFAEQCEPGYGTALQCGFCTPGFVMAAKGFLHENPHPTLDEVKEALSGNLCRCGCYAAIAQAVLRAADKMASQGRQEV
ncbi:MAG TPA: (2Fe-2S)-binding protein [Anaerolineae bacterium]|nr:(2Fe-2S)-binding protein [Anaerolineae bacterium]